MRILFALAATSTILFSCKNSDIQRRENGPAIEGEFNIIGGSDYTENDSSYLKGVVRVLNEEGFECSGIIVDKKFILTAHHCVVTKSGYNQDPKKLRVNFDMSATVASSKDIAVEAVHSMRPKLQPFLILPHIKLSSIPFAFHGLDVKPNTAVDLFTAMTKKNLNDMAKYIEQSPQISTTQLPSSLPTDASTPMVGILIPDDIALLKLVKDIPNTNLSLRLLDPRVYDRVIKEKLKKGGQGVAIDIAGYGRTSTTSNKAVNLQFASQTAQEEQTIQATDKLPEMNFISYQEKVAEGNTYIPRGACVGDSGGPMMLSNTDHSFSPVRYVMGITSFGFSQMSTNDIVTTILNNVGSLDAGDFTSLVPCSQASVNNHAMYTKLSEPKYIKWIQSKIAGYRTFHIQKCGYEKVKCETYAPIATLELSTSPLKCPIGSYSYTPGESFFETGSVTQMGSTIGCRGWFKAYLQDLPK